MMIKILIVISLLFVSCDSIYSPAPVTVYEGNYMQTETVMSDGSLAEMGDTAWWSFSDAGKNANGDRVSDVYGAYKLKVRNGEGHMPIEHYRGSITISFDEDTYQGVTRNVKMCQMLIKRVVMNCSPTWNGDVENYTNVTDQVNLKDFEVKVWRSDSIYMKEIYGPYSEFEAGPSNTGDLSSSAHPAYEELPR